jgi:Short C-terminal domain/Phospholipase_D-nuclease N-terminal
MPIAADYPFLDIFWTILIFFSWVIWIWIVIVVFSDVFRRTDIGGWAKAGWVVLVIVLPFVGVLIYLIAQHDGMNERNAAQAKAVQEQFDSRVRAASGSEGSAAEIEKAAALRDAGTITSEEFETIKAKALAAQ